MYPKWQPGSRTAELGAGRSAAPGPRGDLRRPENPNPVLAKRVRLPNGTERPRAVRKRATEIYILLMRSS